MKTTRWILLVGALPLSVRPQADVEWPAYANDAGGSHYSTAAEISRGNVAALQVAWTYHTGALEPESDLNKKVAFEATPVMLDGTLYLSTPFDKVIAGLSSGDRRSGPLKALASTGPTKD